MLKIIFSSEDILRTRVAPAADPVWELVLSLHLLQGRGRDPLLTEWRRTVARGLRTDSAAERYRLLLALNPPRGYFPDFLTPYASKDGLEAGLSDQLGLLSGGTRLDDRHRSARSALDWSFGMLDGIDRAVLRRASVFAAPFTAAAAAQVTGFAPSLPGQVVGSLGRLSDHNLLVAIAGPDGTSGGSPEPDATRSGRLTRTVVTFGVSLNRRIGYVTQSRLVTRFLSNMSSSWSTLLAPWTRFPDIWFISRSGLIAKPESCAAIMWSTFTLPDFLSTSTWATVAAYESLWVPMPMPQPRTTFPLSRFAAGTCGTYPAALAASTAAFSTPA